MLNDTNQVAWARFTTTVAPAQPTTANSATNRTYRCTVTRDAAAAGLYLLNLSEPIADADCDITATPTQAQTGGTAWHSCTVDRVSDTQYRIGVWASATQLLSQGLPAFGSLTDDGTGGVTNAAAPVTFTTDGPTFGGVVRSGATNGLVLPIIGTYEITYSVPFADPSEVALFVDPNTGVFAQVTTSSSISGPDADNVQQPQTVTEWVTTTAINSIIELRNVGQAAIAPTAPDLVLTQEPQRWFTAKLLRQAEAVTVTPAALSDLAGIGVRVSVRKVSPG